MRVLRPWLVLLVCVRVAEAQPVPEGSDADKPAEPAPPPPAPAPPPPPAPTAGAVTGTVEAPDLDAPLAGATVTIVGTKISTTTDDEGHYALDAQPGVLHVRADFAGFRSEERVVNVAAGASAKLDFALATAPMLTQTVVAVGSRTPRTNVDSPVAVDVITSEDIGRSGRTETGRVLGQLEPSYLSVPQTIADGSDHVDPASLRGLGPDQVLVLVNGKRRHRSALLHVNGTFGRGTVGTDLNAYPIGCDQADRGPARRRGLAVRLRRDRRCHQHRHQGHDRQARRRQRGRHHRVARRPAADVRRELRVQDRRQGLRQPHRRVPPARRDEPHRRVHRPGVLAGPHDGRSDPRDARADVATSSR